MQQMLQDALSFQGGLVSTPTFIVALVLTATLTYLLSLFYVRFGSSLSNKRTFSNNFILISLTTMVVISIVKSSLALSLGLVGALSIIRFRTAIKDPEELSYLFLSIAVGLGMGAGQIKVTVIAFIFIGGVIALRGLVARKEDSQNLFFTLSQSTGDRVDSQEILDTLKRHCTMVNLRRYEQTDQELEISFSVVVKDFKNFDKIKSEVQKLGPKLNLTFLDPSGVQY